MVRARQDQSTGTLYSVLVVPWSRTYDLPMTEDETTARPSRIASWNDPPGKSYAAPIPEDEVIAIMQRAEAAVGHPCHLWPCMRDLQRTREDGWTNLGSIGEKESEKSYVVWWHRERQQGWLWASEHTDRGVRSRPFDPPEG